MSEFTTRIRNSDTEFSINNGVVTPTSRNAEYTYSWRTRRSKKDLDEALTGNNVGGIRMPLKHGSLGARIQDRKRFSEDLDRAFSAAHTSYQDKLVCQTDTGHPFTNVKYGNVGNARFIQRNRTTKVVSLDTPVYAFGQAYRPPELDSTPGFVTNALPVGLSAPTVLERNNRLNPIFAEMRPNKEIAQIGETVFSLLAGDIPSILKNLRKYAGKLASYKDAAKNAPKYIGSEYLNSTFGWAPLIDDFTKAIKVLTTVDSLIYGSSFGRKRRITFDHKTVRDNSIATIRSAYGGTAAESATVASAGGYREFSMNYDIRLSARIVPLARPGAGANAFIDQAQEKIQQLGIWYPALGWDLLPYSWLIDWVTNLGASITNAQSYGNKPGQNLIDYAYATSLTTVYCEGFPNKRGWTNAGLTSEYLFTGTAKTVSTVKTRFAISPYGPGINLPALNPGQIASLVALGTVKLP